MECLALDRCNRRRGRAGAIPGIGLAIVIAVIEFPVGRLAPIFGGPGTRSRRQGLTTTSRAIPTRRLIPGLVLFRWMRPCSSPTPSLFSNRVQDAVAASPTPVRRLVVAPSRSPASTSRPPTCCRAGGHLARAGIELCFAENEGSGQGQAQALRPVRAARRERVLPDDGQRRQQLCRDPSGGLGGLGDGAR